ncbi:MAG: heavy-metal-associated domain-containing protein [Novosphingobium sp.]
MSQTFLTKRLAAYRPGPAVQLLGGLSLALGIALVAIGPARLIAQIEGDRGIIPMARSTDIEVTGIEVNATGKTGQEAREAGWREAYKKAWAQLKGPAMPDSQIEGMVSAVVIEREQIGPHRYIATLTISFDRTHAGQFVGGGGDGAGGQAVVAHSAPMLVVPVLYSGGVAQVYEVRSPWQRAWAEFRAGTSAIDYIRPVGTGADSLLLTAGQVNRRSRAWWRNVLDVFGASDVVMPVARLERQWPGGAVRGTFTARYGPDSMFIESFTLTANDESGVPAMLAQAVQRFDSIYAQALAQGVLRPDPTLNERPAVDPALAALIAAAKTADQAAAVPVDAAAAPLEAASAAPTTAPPPPAVASSFAVQFASPDAKAVDAALGAVRGAAGVQGAATSSIAIGGTSVMRVTFAGDLNALAAALRTRGWQVTVGNGALSIRR